MFSGHSTRLVYGNRSSFTSINCFEYSDVHSFENGFPSEGPKLNW